MIATQICTANVCIVYVLSIVYVCIVYVLCIVYV
jgi:hypothetical protein